MDNIDASAEELAEIRAFADFDIVMFLSELNDHGWEAAKALLEDIRNANRKLAGGNQ